MYRLLLLRHAKSDWDDRRLADHARPLNPRGRAAARLMGEMMRKNSMVPELVLVSSALRTLETLRGLELGDKQPEIRVLDTLYLASPAGLLESLRGAGQVGCVMLIGHNPGLHELALQLAEPWPDRSPAEWRRIRDGYPTAALAEFAITGESWADLKPATATLRRFVMPRDLSDGEQ